MSAFLYYRANAKVTASQCHCVAALLCGGARQEANGASYEWE